MRVAALFDIHGNLPALEAVLREVEEARVDVVVCGGDAVPAGLPDAAQFADECVLSRASPAETAPFFEQMAAERERAAQSANSEK